MTEELSGRRIVVPETRELGQLLRMLEQRGADTVPCPMIAEDARVIAIISEMAAGRVDAIAFTSAPQVRRFRDVARAFGREAELRQGFERTVVAAVGPIVAAELDALGVEVNVRPPKNTFYMKPLVRELAAALTKDHKG
jgi:uroporphyrinogen-III synthase